MRPQKTRLVIFVTTPPSQMFSYHEFMPCFPVTCTLEKKTFRQIGSQQTCSSLRDEPLLRILPTWSQTSAQYNNNYTCKPCKLKLMKKREKLKRQLLTTSIFCSPTFWVTIWKNILCHHVQKSVTNVEL